MDSCTWGGKAMWQTILCLAIGHLEETIQISLEVCWTESNCQFSFVFFSSLKTFPFWNKSRCEFYKVRVSHFSHILELMSPCAVALTGNRKMWDRIATHLLQIYISMNKTSASAFFFTFTPKFISRASCICGYRKKILPPPFKCRVLPVMKSHLIFVRLWNYLNVSSRVQNTQ